MGPVGRWILLCMMSFLGGVIGLVIATIIGGNFATEFRFAGTMGYEATGILGFIIGSSIASVVSFRYVEKTQPMPIVIGAGCLLGGVIMIVLAQLKGGASIPYAWIFPVIGGYSTLYIYKKYERTL